VATAVVDRMELIEMPFYSDDQKVVIAKDYLMPESLAAAGMKPEMVQIDPTLWVEIVRPLGFDGGIRSLKRNVDTLVRRLAKMVVEGNAGPFVVNSTNIKQFLPVG
jgi:ATP-dependent Lon protease